MNKVYIVAEAGVNHNGQLALARDLVNVAADSGADAVKFQTFDAKKLATSAAPKAAYQVNTTDAEESQLEMLQMLELPHEWHWELADLARSRGIEFLSTAFDSDSLSFLEKLNMPFYKVPSGELTNGPLLWKFARTRRPLVVSTGMATLSEVEEALAIINHALNADEEPQNIQEVWRGWSNSTWRTKLLGRVTLLHCTSQYPTPIAECNLRAMDALGVFGLPVGYSDHTEGTLVPVAAVARGATFIEKHFTLDRTMPGPDHKASLEPGELVNMVKQIRDVERAMGDSMKCPQQSEWNTRLAARQSVVAARPIKAGHLFSRDDLKTARSGGQGIPPNSLWELVGATAMKDCGVGEPISRWPK
ncbi:MAG: N-acetylneuraminate synthase [Limnobacter sp. CACIAM 66H1]|uniref:N-acetylneuraminate synthase n=1 Tax=Limnobacter sp. CACIAM 66H1 TaxID=1813033 RepID=UPI0007A8B34F|nr:N-acetylneuraminate synthase [Limnobacter sp. CACIAM 66H1]KYP11479.1 MAG: N-acetylneuraminate synthase [Limnobacter sp. CACIAM 66H1]